MKRFKVILIICLAICFSLSLGMVLSGCGFSWSSSESVQESTSEIFDISGYRVKAANGGYVITDLEYPELVVDNNGIMEIPAKIYDEDVVKIDFKGKLQTYDLNLQYLIIPKTVKEIGKDSFAGLDKLSTVVFKSDSEIEKIGDRAFKDCSALNVFTTPNSLKRLGLEVFMGCSSLTSFNVGANLEMINSRCFVGSGISAFTVNAENVNYSAIDGVLFNKTKTRLVAYPSNKISSSYTLPTTVLTIDEYSFFGNTNLQEVFLQDVDNIRRMAFANCINLEKITGDSVTAAYLESFENTAWYNQNKNNEFFKIGKVLLKYNGIAQSLDLREFRAVESYAFVQEQESVSTQYSYNTTLKSVTIGRLLNNLRENTFYNCSAIESICIISTDEIMIMSKSAFNGISEDVKVYVQLQLVDEYSQEFENVEFYPITTKVNYYSGEQKVYEDTAYWGELYTASYTPDYQGGYRFEGWFEDEDFTSRFTQREFFVVDSEFNLYAKIIEGGYRIVYLKEKNYIFGGDRYEYGDTIELKEFPLSGYVFVGWFWDEECTDLVEESELVGIYGDLVFYGKWKDISVTFISPVGNKTDGGDYYQLFYDKTALFQQDYPILVYKNAQFYGWYDGERGTGNLIIDAQGNVLVDEVPNYLYAGWQTFTITYSCDYGVELPENPTTYSYYDGEIELLEPTLENCRFVGWVYGGDVVTHLDKNISGDIVLVAHFELL